VQRGWGERGQEGREGTIETVSRRMNKKESQQQRGWAGEEEIWGERERIAKA